MDAYDVEYSSEDEHWGDDHSDVEPDFILVTLIQSFEMDVQHTGTYLLVILMKCKAVESPRTSTPCM
jgi:hypothetical protein